MEQEPQVCENVERRKFVSKMSTKSRENLDYKRCIKCGIRKHYNFSDVSFHTIPPEKKALWLSCLGLNPNTILTSKSRVCSRHFDGSAFKNPESQLKRLKDDAKPHNKHPNVIVSRDQSRVS